jgi:hypothetical protein
LLSGLGVGKSLGTEDGNGDGRGAIGVTAGPGAFIGRGAFGAAFRGGSFDRALRRFGAAFFVAFLAFALRAGFRAADFLRAGAARFFDLTVFLAVFFALRFFAMMSS